MFWIPGPTTGKITTVNRLMACKSLFAWVCKQSVHASSPSSTEATGSGPLLPKGRTDMGGSLLLSWYPLSVDLSFGGKPQEVEGLLFSEGQPQDLRGDQKENPKGKTRRKNQKEQASF